MNNILKAIFRTLTYADIFAYPLNDKEIWEYLITDKKVNLQSLTKELARVVDKKLILQDSGFYFLPGREMIVALRKRRKMASRNKMKIAHRVAGRLKFIPTIKMVAITGALAMDNSEKNDDIDLLIVTDKKRLWLTRLLTIFLVELVAQRRRPKDKEFKDKICLNMFLDEENLQVPPIERNLFSAHEACQLKPIWNRGDTYKRFVRANKWTTRYLANWKN